MTFSVSLGFAGLKNEEAKEDADKNYALFIGETVIANEVRMSLENSIDFLPPSDMTMCRYCNHRPSDTLPYLEPFHNLVGKTLKHL